MEQSITIRFNPTLQDALESQFYHRKITVRPALRIGLYVASGFLLLLGAYGQFRGIGTATILFIAGLYYPALRPLERRWQVERSFTKDLDKDLEVEWQISEQALKVKSSKWTLELTWPANRASRLRDSACLLLQRRWPGGAALVVGLLDFLHLLNQTESSAKDYED